MPSETYVLAEQATGYITSLFPETLPRPQIGIICGSGLSGLVSSLHADPQISIPYADIPNFPVSTVAGHQSRFVFGTLGERKVGIAAMLGRLHSYEGHDMRHITLPIRVFHLLGIKTLIGSTRPILNADLQLQMLQEV
jgi:purine-nucleoside phosphorylase